MSAPEWEDVFTTSDIARIWAVEYTSVDGRRLVEVVGTEGAARWVADNRATAAPTLLVYEAHLISRIDFG